MANAYEVGLEWPVVFIPGCHAECIPHKMSDDKDEERRLLYVAMTRAKCLLYMSLPAKNHKKGIALGGDE
jgi:ATP-dependent DNA helicase UvrD/PcrA